MKHEYKIIWKEALKYLKKGINKDFVKHTEGVIRAMELILKKEEGNPDILIPAAILHDVGWAKVPKEFQRTSNKKKKIEGMRLHIDYAPEIIRIILKSLNYNTSTINNIIEVVVSHKFHNPRKLNKRLLIDADQLSDSFKDQFYSDVKSYKTNPNNLYNFRMKNNHFYSKIANDIFFRQMKKRYNEIILGKNED